MNAYRPGMLCLALVAGMIAAGCGDDRSTAEQPAPPPSPKRTPTTQTTFGARGAPPAGVAGQVDYFQEGGPYECDPDPVDYQSGEPFMAVNRSTPRFSDGVGDDEKRRPDIGDVLAVCGYGFSSAEPVQLSIRDPRGREHTEMLDAPFESDVTTVQHNVKWLPSHPLGVYRIEMSQGDLRLATTARLGLASEPGYRTLSSQEVRRPTLVFAGLEPAASILLVAYLPDSGSVSGIPKARYAGSARIEADARGLAQTVLESPPGVDSASPDVEGGCYVVKAYVDGAMLDDRHNTLSTVCIDGNGDVAGGA